MRSRLAKFGFSVQHRVQDNTCIFLHYGTIAENQDLWIGCALLGL